jgi:hypothetical protein
MVTRLGGKPQGQSAGTGIGIRESERPGSELATGVAELVSRPGMAPFREVGTESTEVRHDSAG